MSRYIDADELMKTISSTKFTSLGANDILVTCCQIVIDNAPTADVRENVRGEWILHIDDLFPAESTMECNQCHKHQPITIDDNFCPNCGADMRADMRGEA